MSISVLDYTILYNSLTDLQVQLRKNDPAEIDASMQRFLKVRDVIVEKSIHKEGIKEISDKIGIAPDKVDKDSERVKSLIDRLRECVNPELRPDKTTSSVSPNKLPNMTATASVDKEGGLEI